MNKRWILLFASYSRWSATLTVIYTSRRHKKIAKSTVLDRWSTIPTIKLNNNDDHNTTFLIISKSEYKHLQILPLETNMRTSIGAKQASGESIYNYEQQSG